LSCERASVVNYTESAIMWKLFISNVTWLKSSLVLWTIPGSCSSPGKVTGEKQQPIGALPLVSETI